jgi:hypothetical protein
LVLQRTCELINDSSLWCSNFIPSVRVSIIIIGSGFVTFIFLVRVSFINVGSGFSIKNLNFSFLGANIPILFVESQSMSVEVRISALYKVNSPLDRYTTSQPPLNLTNYIILNGLRLKRGLQRKTEIL